MPSTSEQGRSAPAPDDSALRRPEAPEPSANDVRADDSETFTDEVRAWALSSSTCGGLFAWPEPNCEG